VTAAPAAPAARLGTVCRHLRLGTGSSGYKEAQHGLAALVEGGALSRSHGAPADAAGRGRGEGGTRGVGRWYALPPGVDVDAAAALFDGAAAAAAARRGAVSLRAHGRGAGRPRSPRGRVADGRAAGGGRGRPSSAEAGDASDEEDGSTGATTPRRRGAAPTTQPLGTDGGGGGSGGGGGGALPANGAALLRLLVRTVAAVTAAPAPPTARLGDVTRHLGLATGASAYKAVHVGLGDLVARGAVSLSFAPHKAGAVASAAAGGRGLRHYAPVRGLDAASAAALCDGPSPWGGKGESPTTAGAHAPALPARRGGGHRRPAARAGGADGADAGGEDRSPTDSSDGGGDSPRQPLAAPGGVGGSPLPSDGPDLLHFLIRVVTTVTTPPGPPAVTLGTVARHLQLAPGGTDYKVVHRGLTTLVARGGLSLSSGHVGQTAAGDRVRAPRRWYVPVPGLSGAALAGVLSAAGRFARGGRVRSVAVRRRELRGPTARRARIKDGSASEGSESSGDCGGDGTSDAGGRSPSGGCWSSEGSDGTGGGCTRDKPRRRPSPDRGSSRSPSAASPEPPALPPLEPLLLPSSPTPTPTPSNAHQPRAASPPPTPLPCATGRAASSSPPLDGWSPDPPSTGSVLCAEAVYAAAAARLLSHPRHTTRTLYSAAVAAGGEVPPSPPHGTPDDAYPVPGAYLDTTVRALLSAGPAGAAWRPADVAGVLFVPPASDAARRHVGGPVWDTLNALVEAGDVAAVAPPPGATAVRGQVRAAGGAPAWTRTRHFVLVPRTRGSAAVVWAGTAFDALAAVAGVGWEGGGSGPSGDA